MNKIAKYIVIVIIIFSIPISTSYSDTTNPLTGTWYGSATITSPATLGTVDLAFYLDVTGTAVQHDSSYIVLDKTLLFPADPPQVGGKDVGPRATGTVSPTSFDLTVDRFNSTLAEKAVYKGGSTLADATVTRDVTLGTTTVANGGTSITGTYTEIITGLGPNPVTVTGSFILVKPTPFTTPTLKSSNGTCVSFADIAAAGSDPSVIEYGDVSQALHLFNNSGISPNLCSPRDQIMNDALTNYYTTLK